MSSGNPFRASISQHPAAASPVRQTSFITANSSVPEVSGDGRSEPEAAPPPKTKKHVRIGSNTTFIPPHPDSGEADDSPRSPPIQRPDYGNHVVPSRAVHSANTSHADMYAGRTDAPSAGWGNAMTTSDIWAGAEGGYQPPQSAIPPSGAPANPFSRTLASIEPQGEDSREGRTPAERPALGANRASLDVESFKNLLLTGNPGPRLPGQPVQTTAQQSITGGPQFESSSSTDTSSVSQQSLFEPPHHTRTESPRTSIEIAESDEDESVGLVSEVKKGKKKPPPAPKHHHGKLVSPRQPQTVPFESFSASQPPPSPVTRSRDSPGVNKRLPPIPAVSSSSQHISAQDTSTQRPIPAQQYSSESLVTPEAPRLQKKTPPPVPLARRQSQLRTSTAETRSRSNSSLTISSQHSVESSLPTSAPASKDPSSIAKSPPPPPRSRHGARLSDINNSSANSSSTELPQRPGSIRTTASGHDAASSRRSTLDSESPMPPVDVRRTSSITSNRNSQRVVSNESTGSGMPPPPPPPRRRQSNRSSLDLQRSQHTPSSPVDSRRTSLENRRTSLENNRRTSVASESSLRREYAPVEDKGGDEYALYSPNEEAEKQLDLGAALTESRSDSKSILDDMEKFQREIEELRQRYAKAE